MVTLHIGVEDGANIGVDRDGYVRDTNPPRDEWAQGFDIRITEFEIHFDDENQAADMARQILYRLGEIDTIERQKKNG